MKPIGSVYYLICGIFHIKRKKGNLKNLMPGGCFKVALQVLPTLRQIQDIAVIYSTDPGLF
jgi:hypothetical protein